MAAFLSYFAEFMPRIHDLFEKEFISGATLSFPVKDRDEARIHFTIHGILVTMGDRYSSKLIETWEVPPVLYDIYTDAVIGPLEFVKLESTTPVSEFMRRHGVLDIEVTTPTVSHIVKDHYSAQFSDVHVGILTLT